MGRSLGGAAEGVDGSRYAHASAARAEHRGCSALRGHGAQGTILVYIRKRRTAFVLKIERGKQPCSTSHQRLVNGNINIIFFSKPRNLEEAKVKSMPAIHARLVSAEVVYRVPVQGFSEVCTGV